MRPLLGLALSFPSAMVVFWLVFSWNVLGWLVSCVAAASPALAMVLAVVAAVAPFARKDWRKRWQGSSRRWGQRLVILSIAGVFDGLLLFAAATLFEATGKQGATISRGILLNFLRYQTAYERTNGYDHTIGALSGFDLVSSLINHPGLSAIWGVIVASAINKAVTARLDRFVSRRCRIAFFRSFDEKIAAYLRRKLLPILGSYGALDVLLDNVLGMGLLEEFYGIDFNRQFFDPSKERRVRDDEWQSVLPTLITGADVIILDLSLLSANLLREIEACVALAPRKQILFVAHSDVPVDWHGLAERFPQLASGTGSLLTPLRYGGWNVVFRLRLFVWWIVS